MPWSTDWASERNSSSVRWRPPPSVNMKRSKLASPAVGRAEITSSTEQDPRVRASGLGAPAEDPTGVIVREAVQDLGEDVRVAARKRIVEEVSAHGVDALRRLRRGDDAGQVEQRAAEVRVGCKDRPQHLARAAADIDHVLDTAPVVQVPRSPQRSPSPGAP